MIVVFSFTSLRSKQGSYDPDLGSPYGGTAAVIPGVIQLEEYDEGGEGVGYYDITPGNKRGVRGSWRVSWNLAGVYGGVLRRLTLTMYSLPYCNIASHSRSAKRGFPDATEMAHTLPTYCFAFLRHLLNIWTGWPYREATRVRCIRVINFTFSRACSS